MSTETRATLLYCQLQEGLSYNLMKSPAVSGARDYTELSLAAKNEEKRQAELVRRQQYQGVLPRSRSEKGVSQTTHQTRPGAKNQEQSYVRARESHPKNPADHLHPKNPAVVTTVAKQVTWHEAAKLRVDSSVTPKPKWSRRSSSSSSRLWESNLQAHDGPPLTTSTPHQTPRMEGMCVWSKWMTVAVR